MPTGRGDNAAVSGTHATAVRLADVSFAYPGNAQVVLAGVDLEVPHGQFVAIAGPNGGGKTTLLRIVTGLVRPDHGEIELYGREPRAFAADGGLGYLPQRARLGTTAPTTVREVVVSGRARLRRFGRLRKVDHQAAIDALELVGLADHARAPLQSLSGGQQQRVFLARLLAGEPSLVLLDEPTTGVDADAQEAFGQLLCRLNQERGVTVLYVSHEFGAVETLVDRLVLVRGGIAFDGPASELPAHWHDPSHSHA